MAPRERVLLGTELVQGGKADEAVEILEPLVTELGGRLTDEEAGAANYNLACAYSRLRQFDKAGDPLTRAVNDYGVKYSVVMKDEDLEAYRMSVEFDDVANGLKGGIRSDEQYAKLRVEAKTPFRTFRLFALGGLDAGAGLGLLIILSRLASAIKGGPGAPELEETLKNLAINGTAVAVLTYFFVKDLKSGKEKLKEVEVEETLGRLQVDLGANRVVPMSRLRAQYRPVILQGDEAFLKKCIKSASSLKKDLKSKGILLIPLQDSKGLSFKRTEGLGESKGFDAAGSKLSPDGIEEEQRWVVQPRGTPEWFRWLEVQKEASQALQYSESAYVQVQLDGTVRSMGPGQPDWKELLSLPDKESFQSKVTG
ncbi:protein LOW PSII ACCUMULATION 1 [Chloropicon primus]|uniref:Uncharacterized protein n=1 Tax=Chloropicon primus TaxID=1764295 RepID=A0A5B8MMI1_9CHLO|nr:hypothetical protein A3770_05p37620 [Chloropicon primus]UPR00458.1 protein LOW PSII ACCUMULATION 1 [Chloropicon primus]|eukprot:QDZ21244.1 hypothetical protein A3770_05p37620 [Chloropicon primus]